MPQPQRELTPTSVILGLVLSVVMGAANVYLGLKVGMTISASIPAAVIAMAVLHGVMGRSSVLEANQVQTAASAGESLAAGIVFTIPAFLLAGLWTHFDYWTTTLIGLAGGLLGVLLMIPMRRVFVVADSELKFPEGVACAEVLRASARVDGVESNTGGARAIFLGLAVGALFKFSEAFLGLVRDSVEWATFRAGRVFYLGTDIGPALIAVGAIVGLPIAAQLFAGGAISWLISIPLLFDVSNSTMSPVEAANNLWETKVRFIGVGAMLVGGIDSIWRVRAGLLAAVRELASQLRPRSRTTDLPETDRDIGYRSLLLLTTATVALIGGIYYSLLGSAGLTLTMTAIMLVMAFFFTAVASYIVGLVGNSNSPVSGMTISAVLATAGLIALFRWTGWMEADGDAAILATLGVAGVICCVACTSGDVCNDLKTGYLVGASPRRQQIMEVMGVIVAAFVMAPVMTILHEGSLLEGTGGIGGKAWPAPQAKLFKELVVGIFREGQLPRDMILYGVGVGAAIVFVDWLLRVAGVRSRLYVMPVAVGIYLPFGIAPPILLGGLMHHLLTRKQRGGEVTSERGVLVASGVIAGESLFGILLAGMTFLGMRSLNLGEKLALELGPSLSSLFGESTDWPEAVMMGFSLVVLFGLAAWMFWMSLPIREQKS